jgi:hypothetical protein
VNQAPSPMAAPVVLSTPAVPTIGVVVPIDKFRELGWTARLIPLCPPTKVPGFDDSQLGKVPAKLSRGKVHLAKGWRESRATDADIQNFQGWQYKGIPFNFGMQTDGLLVIDCDVDDAAASETVMQTLREVFKHKPPIRSRPGATRFSALLRPEVALHKTVIKTVGGKVELLADGQQFVVTGTHYESGQPIIWLTPPVSLDALPVATSEQVQQFVVLIKQRIGLSPAPLQVASATTQPAANILGNNMQRSGWFDGLQQPEQAVELRKMLDCLPADYCSERELWVCVGMALHSVGGWTQQIWDDWSQRTTAPNYDAGANLTSWNSFNGTSGVTVGTLIMLARQHGYAPPIQLLANPQASTSPAQKKPAMRLSWMDAIVNNPPICRWLLPDMIPQQGTVAIVARSNAGKSLMSIHIAACVATGAACFGRKPSITGPVIYVAAEAPSSVKNRLRAYCQRHGLDPLKLPIAVIDGVNLSSDSTVAELCQVIEDGIHSAVLPAPALVIFDTLRRTTPEAEENSSTEMDQALQRLQAVAEHFAATVLLTHHYGKNEHLGPRGTSALRASFDVEIGVDQVKNSPQREWTIAKSRDGNDSVTGLFEIEEVELPATTAYPQPSRWPVLVEPKQNALQVHHFQNALAKALHRAQPRQRKVFDMTRTLTAAGPVSMTDWIDKVIKPIYPGNKNPKDRARELTKALSERNLITSDGNSVDVTSWVRNAGRDDTPADTANGKTETP